jgi:hypothetical protein
MFSFLEVLVVPIGPEDAHSLVVEKYYLRVLD